MNFFPILSSQEREKFVHHRHIFSTVSLFRHRETNNFYIQKSYINKTRKNEKLITFIAEINLISSLKHLSNVMKLKAVSMEEDTLDVFYEKGCKEIEFCEDVWEMHKRFSSFPSVIRFGSFKENSIFHKKNNNINKKPSIMNILPLNDTLSCHYEMIEKNDITQELTKSPKKPFIMNICSWIYNIRPIIPFPTWIGWFSSSNKQPKKPTEKKYISNPYEWKDKNKPIWEKWYKGFKNNQIYFLKNEEKIVLFEQLFFEMCQVMIHMEEFRFIQSDIKRENIICDYTTDGYGIFQMIDFGYSHPYISKYSPKIFCGTMGNEPPEMSFLKQNPLLSSDTSFSPQKRDVWSLGIALLEFLIGIPLFSVHSNYKYDLCYLSHYPNNNNFHSLLSSTAMEKATIQDLGDNLLSLDNSYHVDVESILTHFHISLPKFYIKALSKMLTLNPKHRPFVSEILITSHEEYFIWVKKIQNDARIFKDMYFSVLNPSWIKRCILNTTIWETMLDILEKHNIKDRYLPWLSLELFLRWKEKKLDENIVLLESDLITCINISISFTLGNVISSYVNPDILTSLQGCLWNPSMGLLFDEMDEHNFFYIYSSYLSFRKISPQDLANIIINKTIKNMDSYDK